MSSGSTTPRTPNATSPSSAGSVEHRLHHNHNCSTNGCLGTIPKTPSSYSLHHRGHRSHSFRVSVRGIEKCMSIRHAIERVRDGWEKCVLFRPSCSIPLSLSRVVMFSFFWPAFKLTLKAFVCLTLSNNTHLLLSNRSTITA